MARIKINIKDGTIKRSDKVLGIDLGTTNSLIAYVDPATSQPVCLGDDSDKIVPSVIYFNDNNEMVVGQAAKLHLIEDADNTVYSVKRLLGRSYTDIADHANSFGYHLVADDSKAMVNINIRGKIYNPIELSAQILKALKLKAETALGEPVTKAVITVPAYFNDSQRQATRDAGKLAGLDVLRIVNEPTAASLAYGIGLDKSQTSTIAVYDLGGGTFDITILSIQNGVFEVLSTNGDTYTGGDDFDRAIVNYWCQNLGIDIQTLEANKSAYQNIRLKAEAAKITLSGSEQYSDEIAFNGQTYQLSIDKKTFEQQIQPIVEKTLKCCRVALKDAGLTHTDIDEVVMVGGSTRTPYVIESVKRLFRKEQVNNRLNPDEVVALGAAIEADILAGNRKDILLLDVTPLSLGIETLGGMMDTIIPRNSKVPTNAGRQYTTSKDGQLSLRISVYQGEREMVADNRKLGEFILEGIPAMPAGLPKIDIRFMLNADGILSIEAVEMRSGIRQTIEIQPQYGLTDAEVENMLLAAMSNAEADMQKRQLTETITEAEQVMYQCRKLLNANQTLLSEAEVDMTQAAISELEALCKGSDREAINQAIERLNSVTRPFAERLMDQAIGKALTGKKLDAL